MNRQKIIHMAIVAASASMLLAAPALAQGPPLGRWFTRAPLPTARQEMALALLDEKIYVPGGFIRGGAGTALVEVFEPAANRWSAFTNLPIALNHLAVVTVDARLYVVGGYTGSGNERLVSGVYHYTLRAGGLVRSQKMVLLR